MLPNDKKYTLEELDILFEKEYGSLRNASFLTIEEYERIKEWALKSGYFLFQTDFKKFDIDFGFLLVLDLATEDEYQAFKKWYLTNKP